MKTSTKFILTAAFIGIGLSGLARNVYANQSKSVAIMPQHQSNTQIAEASDGDGEVVDDAEERQEATRLQTLAKITPQQAQQAAQTAQGGTASRVNLDNEEGSLVYKVTIAQTEVSVDAGNGQVLYTENLNQEDNAAAEANRPKSSIQLPDTNEQDNEVNDDGRVQQGS